MADHLQGIFMFYCLLENTKFRNSLARMKEDGDIWFWTYLLLSSRKIYILATSGIKKNWRTAWLREKQLKFIYFPINSISGWNRKLWTFAVTNLKSGREELKDNHDQSYLFTSLSNQSFFFFSFSPCPSFLVGEGPPWLQCQKQPWCSIQNKIFFWEKYQHWNEKGK